MCSHDLYAFFLFHFLNKNLLDHIYYHLIKSLEKIDNSGNFVSKADIFSKKTINSQIVVDHCNNALTEQWGDAFRTLYPNSNVLVATEKNLKPENRRDLFRKNRNG